MGGRIGYSFFMAKFLAPNLDSKGRKVRAILGSSTVLAGVAVGFWDWRAGMVLGIGGGFMLFEASRGWCVVRACGIKTKI
jgi:hypothetical protein